MQGSSSLQLGKPPLLGAAGAAMDAWRVLVGTRLLQQAAISLAIRLPLPMNALITVGGVLLTRNNGAFCKTEVRVGGGGAP